jgi:aspartyl-tRNA(Asn)/glutamyl-tRNA(Gln) amidotransferase subunit B
MASKYETVIGLEIHAQLKTESKMFCRCDNYSVNAEPNTNTCPVCMGFPGTLPVANKKAIEWTYLFGMALGAEITDKFNFERKNYFYPDLPKAYQITSSTNPPVIGGLVLVDVDGIQTKVRINHVHLEEDAGKLIHPEGKAYSLVDLNRAGTPLMEIVTEPDMRSPKEARIFMQDLRSILRYLGISDANMEQGNLRCDANISLRPEGQKELGKKVEIKNMNSFKMIEKALEYEMKRQTAMLDEGKTIIQETRGWNDAKGITIGQRSKEEANDYRYFPEPDLPPINVKSKNAIDLAEVKTWLPELPKEKRTRFEAEYGLNSAEAELLTSDLELSVYFEKAIEAIPEITDNTEIKKAKAKKVAGWIINELLGRLNKFSVQLSQNKVKPDQIADLVEMIDQGEISGKVAKDVFDEMFETGIEPAKIVEEKGFKQVSDTSELDSIIDTVLSENEKSVLDYKAGKQQAFGFLIGQIMAKTKGQANPKLVNEILREKLK